MISKAFYVAAMSVRAGRTCPSDICRRLPSDPVSRRTPLPLAVSFPQSGRFGDLRPFSVCSCRTNMNKSRQRRGWREGSQIDSIASCPQGAGQIYGRTGRTENPQ